MLTIKYYSTRFHWKIYCFISENFTQPGILKLQISYLKQNIILLGKGFNKIENDIIKQNYCHSQQFIYLRHS